MTFNGFLGLFESWRLKGALRIDPRVKCFTILFLIILFLEMMRFLTHNIIFFFIKCIFFLIDSSNFLQMKRKKTLVIEAIFFAF